MREHAEDAAFVKEAVYDLVETDRVVQYVPEGILEIEQSLLEVPRKGRVFDRDVMSGGINELRALGGVVDTAGVLIVGDICSMRIIRILVSDALLA